MLLVKIDIKYVKDACENRSCRESLINVKIHACGCECEGNNRLNAINLKQTCRYPQHEVLRGNNTIKQRNIYPSVYLYI